MVLVEIGAIVVFAGLVSAWAIWVYPKMKCGKEGISGSHAYTTGECSYGLAQSKDAPCEQGEEEEGKEEVKEEGKEEGDKQNEAAEECVEKVVGKEERSAATDPDVLYWDGEKYTSKDQGADMVADETKP